MVNTRDAASDDSKDKDGAAYLRRREQVRRAQRTHRERKEAYIKSLENEVLQLRTNEAKILQESKNLHLELGRLKEIVDRGGAAYGQSSGYTHALQISADSPFSGESLLSVRDRDRPHILKARQSTSDLSGYASTTTTANSHEDFDGRDNLEGYYGGGSNSVTSTPAFTEDLSLKDMDQTSVSMDFVHHLESPRLYHARQSLRGGSEAQTSHHLTASEQLLLFQPSAHQVPHISSQEPQTPSWRGSNADLERLLSLSDRPHTTEEITPVQAWNQIRSQPHFEGLENGRLRKWTGEMLTQTRSYGYEESRDVRVENEYG